MKLNKSKGVSISHQVATAMCLFVCARTHRKPKPKQNEFTKNVEMIIYDWIFFSLYIEVFVDRFLGYFSSFNICQLNTERTHSNHIQTYRNVLLHNDLVIAPTTNKIQHDQNDANEWREKKWNWIVGGCVYMRTLHRDLYICIPKSHDHKKCENIYNCIFILYYFHQHFPWCIKCFTFLPEYKSYWKQSAAATALVKYNVSVPWNGMTRKHQFTSNQPSTTAA